MLLASRMGINKPMLVLLVIAVTIIPFVSTPETNQVTCATVQTGFRSSSSQTHDDRWICDLQVNIDNPQWFYDHLNNSDRLKVRTAMDIGIPRQSIVQTLLYGLGTTPATPLPQSKFGYNSSIVVRENNLSVARALLTEVFGYTFNINVENSTTPFSERAPYFRLTQSTPSSNPTRIQWSNRIEEGWTFLGIGANTIVETFPTLIARNFDNPTIDADTGIGVPYDQGGFDVQYIGWNSKDTEAGHCRSCDSLLSCQNQLCPYLNTNQTMAACGPAQRENGRLQYPCPELWLPRPRTSRRRINY